jgi:hypothetical protein
VLSIRSCASAMAESQNHTHRGASDEDTGVTSAASAGAEEGRQMPLQLRCTTYPSPAVARQAVERSLATGTAPGDVQLLIGRPVHDIRNEPVGSFAGTIGPDAPVGTFGDVTCLRRQAAGGWAGDADRQRQGSFADAEHAEVVTFGRGREVSRTLGHREPVRLLQPAAHADRLLTDLYRGQVLLIVTGSAETAPIGARLDQLPKAA